MHSKWGLQILNDPEQLNIFSWHIRNNHTCDTWFLKPQTSLYRHYYICRKGTQTMLLACHIDLESIWSIGQPEVATYALWSDKQIASHGIIDVVLTGETIFIVHPGIITQFIDLLLIGGPHLEFIPKNITQFIYIYVVDWVTLHTVHTQNYHRVQVFCVSLLFDLSLSHWPLGNMAVISKV